eukprot:SAG31_NODE_3636_length_4035_cov_2.230691_2_plen_48_part_00
MYIKYDTKFLEVLLVVVRYSHRGARRPHCIMFAKFSTIRTGMAVLGA